MTDEGVDTTWVSADTESRATEWMNILLDDAKLLTFDYYRHFDENKPLQIGPGLLLGILNIQENNGSYVEVGRPAETVADRITENQPWGENEVERYVDDCFKQSFFTDVYYTAQDLFEDEPSYTADIPGIRPALENIADVEPLVIWEQLYDEIKQFAVSPLDGGLAVNPNGRISPTTKEYNTPPADIKDQAERDEDWGMRFHAAAQNSARPEVAGTLAWSEEDGGGSVMVDGEEIYKVTREDIRDELVERPILMVDADKPEVTVYHGEVYEEETTINGETVPVERTRRHEGRTLHINDILNEYGFNDDE